MTMAKRAKEEKMALKKNQWNGSRKDIQTWIYQ